MTDPIKPAEAFSHAWHGKYDPCISPYPTTTFSVGCFQWLPKAKGGLKCGKVLVRVSGSTENPGLVYSKAAAICAELNAGTYSGPHNVRV